MKTPFKFLCSIVAIFMVALVPCLPAASLTYSPASVQSGDSALVIANKVAVAQSGANSYKNITTAATTAVKATAGVLERVIVNTAGAGSTITLYDNTAGSGTKIATMTSAAQGVLSFNCSFTTGLTAVTASGTPADITIIYR